MRVAAALVCLLLPVVVQAQTNTGTTLRGYVVDADGKPVPYVHVSEAASERYVVSDGNGWFVLALPIQRAQSISARRIGYRPLEMQLGSRSEQEKLLRLVLGEGTPALRTAGALNGYSELLDRSGYYRRMAVAIDGTFMTPDQIRRRDSNGTVGLLRGVAGINVVSRGSGQVRPSVARSNSGCTLGVVMDGKRAADETLPSSVSGAMEIYPNAAAVPEEFRQHVNGCGLVVIWGS